MPIKEPLHESLDVLLVWIYVQQLQDLLSLTSVGKLRAA